MRNYVEIRPDGTVRAFVSSDEYVITGELLRVENIFPKEEEEKPNMRFVVATCHKYGVLEESIVEIDSDTKIDFNVNNSSPSFVKKLQEDYVLGLIWRMGLGTSVQESCLKCKEAMK